jgi:hypothetical protein
MKTHSELNITTRNFWTAYVLMSVWTAYYNDSTLIIFQFLHTFERFIICMGWNLEQNKKTNSVAPVSKRTIPTERQPLVGEVSVGFWTSKKKMLTYRRIACLHSVGSVSRPCQIFHQLQHRFSDLRQRLKRFCVSAPKIRHKWKLLTATPRIFSYNSHQLI